MRSATVALAGLAVLCFVLVNRPVVEAKADDNYSITIKRVEVQKTKGNGDAWDVNDGKPDLIVTVRNLDLKDSKAFTTKESTDVFSADLNILSDVKVSPGQTVRFMVEDRDVATNDTIGNVDSKMTEEGLKKGTIKFEKFGQVIVLEVEFKKL